MGIFLKKSNFFLRTRHSSKFLRAQGRSAFGSDGSGILGLLHRWEKVRKFAGHSARKVRSTQNDTREHIRTGHIRTRQNAQ